MTTSLVSVNCDSRISTPNYKQENMHKSPLSDSESEAERYWLSYYFNCFSKAGINVCELKP